MSKQEFLQSFRIARSLFAHPRVQTDSPALDRQESEKMIARSAIWLTPKSVKGFNADDFSELGPERQQELQSAVSEFLHLAQQVPPTQPASQQQLVAAKAAFTKLRRILDPYLPTPEEGREVEEALTKVDFPAWVASWDCELGSEEDGVPAVWINLYLDETIAPRKDFGRFASQMAAKFRQALSAAGNRRWPYVRVRTAVEHKTV
ncbi:MAG: hypothetical protein ABSG68_11535 [Thermoguttaceae bacterium]|jgi:hypothetical protein